MNARKMKKQEKFNCAIRAVTSAHNQVTAGGVTPVAYFKGVRAAVAAHMGVRPNRFFHKAFGSYWGGWLWNGDNCPQWQASPIRVGGRGENWNKKLAKVPEWYF